MSRSARKPGLTVRNILACAAVIMGLACAVAVRGSATAVAGIAAMASQTGSVVPATTGPPWG